MKRSIAILAAFAALSAWNVQADEAIAYTVVEGDSIQTIAGTYNVTVEDILITNGFEAEEIEVGMVVYIPPEHAKGYFNPDSGDYTVVEGDDLYAIGERFGTTVEAIAEVNELESNEVEVGEVIYIPD